MQTVTYEEDRLVKRHRGTMPVILTCPHDGTETPPPIALFREHLVDDRVTRARRGHDDVPFSEERLLARFRTHARMALRDQTHEVLLEQNLLVEARFQVRHEADREVDFA